MPWDCNQITCIVQYWRLSKPINFFLSWPLDEHHFEKSWKSKKCLRRWEEIGTRSILILIWYELVYYVKKCAIRSKLFFEINVVTQIMSSALLNAWKLNYIGALHNICIFISFETFSWFDVIHKSYHQHFSMLEIPNAWIIRVLEAIFISFKSFFFKRFVITKT